MIGRVLAVLLAATLFVPGAASAGTILEPADETELAQALADAQEDQDVCYGWSVNINGVVSDAGSSVDGPGRPPPDAGCGRFATFLAEVSYTCDSCEGEDSASISIESNLPDPPKVSDLEDLGYGAGDLVGERDDSALLDMVGALPLLAAQRANNVPNVEYAPATGVPAKDGPTNSPGSDLLRDRWFLLVLFGGLLVFGPLWFFYKKGQEQLSMTTTAKE